MKTALVRYGVLGLVAGVVGLGVSFLYLKSPGPAPSPAPTARQLESLYKSEEDWLVARIVGDLAEMALFAKDPGGPLRRAGVVIERPVKGTIIARIESPAGSAIRAGLGLEHSTWAPEDYRQLAARLISSAHVEPDVSAPAEDDALLGRLLDLRPEVIEDGNEAVSLALKTRPADPRLHEDAALLLGAFALREAAGFLSDTRLVLCRATAHLAFAQALRGSAGHGLSGRCANALLAALADRSLEAEAAVARLRAEPGKNDARGAWQRILLMRTSQDWRLLARPATASLAERLEWLRAADETLGCGRALSLAESSRLSFDAATADFAQILSRAPNVEVGNTVLVPGLNATLDEARRIWHQTNGRELSEEGRIAALNEPEQPFLAAEGPRVIAWGDWAARSQRHLAYLLYAIENHYRDRLGSEKMAEAFVADTGRGFSGLTLYPIVSACWEAGRDKPSPEPLAAALDFLVHHPEMITAGAWFGLEEKVLRQGISRERRPASMATWFTTGTVRGTAYDMLGRRRSFYDSWADVKSLERLRAISPNIFELNDRYLLVRYGRAGTLADARSVFGRREEYDVRAMQELYVWGYARKDPARRGLVERMCSLDANECEVLGADCVDAGDEACAVEAYEKAFAEGVDRVRNSWECGWLMRHYLRHNKPDRARAIARGVASTGSAGGMFTMSSYLEEIGRYAEAEEVLHEEARRYPIDGLNFVLIGFYHRMAHVRGDAAYEGKFREAARGLFDGVPRRGDLATFQGPPTGGALIVTDSPALIANGLKTGDVIVALDGLRVENDRQYTAMLEFDYAPELRLIVWRADKYLEIAARRQGRRFGVQLRSYAPR